MQEISQRQKKVAEEIRHILLKALTEQRLPTLTLDRAMVSITEVRISPDLRNAKIFISTFKPEDGADLCAELTRLKGDMKKLISKSIRMKFTPDLSFHYDDRPDGAARIDALLSSDTVKHDLLK